MDSNYPAHHSHVGETGTWLLKRITQRVQTQFRLQDLMKPNGLSPTPGNMLRPRAVFSARNNEVTANSSILIQQTAYSRLKYIQARIDSPIPRRAKERLRWLRNYTRQSKCLTSRSVWYMKVERSIPTIRNANDLVDVEQRV